MWVLLSKQKFYCIDAHEDTKMSNTEENPENIFVFFPIETKTYNQ